MLAIRLQRRGRKGLAHYRMIVQESRQHPSSGKVVAYLGNYDPHTKEVKIDTEQAEKYLSHGAQPSNSAAKLLQANKVKLPSWVEIKTNLNKAPKKQPEESKTESPKSEDSKPAEESAEVESSAPEEAKAEIKTDNEPKTDETPSVDTSDSQEETQDAEAKTDEPQKPEPSEKSE